MQCGVYQFLGAKRVYYVKLWFQIVMIQIFFIDFEILKNKDCVRFLGLLEGMSFRWLRNIKYNN